jgi:hypothetical protein
LRTDSINVAEGMRRNLIFEPLAVASASPKIKPIIPPSIISKMLVPIPLISFSTKICSLQIS